MVKVRGVRGATTVEQDDAEMIVRATMELLEEMIKANGIEEEDVASVLFSTTPDLRSAYPARAARTIGWTHTALMGFQEIDVPDGLPRCIRVLVHWNTSKKLEEIVHVYMNGAEKLRPDFFYPRNKLVLKRENSRS